MRSKSRVRSLEGSVIRLPLLVTMMVLLSMMPGTVRSDPPANPIVPAFCIRFTDIERVLGDVGNDRFRFEFEILNWTDQEVFDVFIALNQGTGFGNTISAAPFFADASIDPNGRPLILKDVNQDAVIDFLDFEDLNEDGLLNDGEDKNADGRLTNDPIPGNLNAPNTWTVGFLGDGMPSATAIKWLAGTPIPFRDLLAVPTGLNGVAAACQLLNGACALNEAGNPILDNGVARIADVEKIDDGPNVLDGFVFTVDDLDIGEVLSLNWFLPDRDGRPIGTANMLKRW